MFARVLNVSLFWIYWPDEIPVYCLFLAAIGLQFEGHYWNQITGISDAWKTIFAIMFKRMFALNYLFDLTQILHKI